MSKSITLLDVAEWLNTEARELRASTIGGAEVDRRGVDTIALYLEGLAQDARDIAASSPIRSRRSMRLLLLAHNGEVR